MSRTVARMFVVAICLSFTAVSEADPLAVVAPCVTVAWQERQALARGHTVGRALPAHHGQVAVPHLPESIERRCARRLPRIREARRARIAALGRRARDHHEVAHPSRKERL